MKIIRFFIVLTLWTFANAAEAQRIVSELESNSDMMMDSRPDSVSSKKEKTVPNDVRAWTVDERFGNIFPTYVDTLQYLFMNSDLPEGERGHYNTLGNVGSPRMSRIFMERPIMSKFFFTQPFDMFFVDTEHFRFYNTKSPFVNATYNVSGTKTTGSDHIKVIYTNNAGKRFNFGGKFDYIYGQGYYDNLSTGFINASGWASYLADKYNFKLYYQHNHMKMYENGGIEDDRYITNPEDMAQNYTSKDIPTMLSHTWNRQDHDIVFFNHHYNLGFYREEEVDSVTTIEEFVPVSKIFHTLKLQNMTRNHRAYKERDNYHSYTYLPGDSTEDVIKNFSVKNLVGLSLCEGFNKWAVFGINAYIGYEYNRYSLPDSTKYGGLYTNTTGLIGRQTEGEHNIMVGGQIIRSQGKMVHYNVDAEFVLAGADIGQFDINGHAEVNIPLLGDTSQVALNAYIKNTNPSYFFRHYHSKHAWWDKDMDKEFRQRIEGVIAIPHTHTTLTVGIENIKNFCYFQNTGILLGSDTNNPIVSNNVSAMQHNGNIQIISANLRQDFQLSILHWDNDITYQATTNADILPLPTISLHSNLYLRFKIARVLKTDIGADLIYFTKYYAPDYSPVIGMFMNQNALKKQEIGNYPILSAYANFDLKRLRFYVQYYHATQGTGRYFWAPHYPINPSCVRFGLSWNFYD